MYRFDNWNERANRARFFARYEAGLAGHLAIEIVDLLIGVIREDRALSVRLSIPEFAEAREQILSKSRSGESNTASTDLQPSDDLKRIFAYASDESSRRETKCIGTTELLLAILREEDSLAAKTLREWGVTLGATREKLKLVKN